jgi:hypothetical protein
MLDPFMFSNCQPDDIRLLQHFPQIVRIKPGVPVRFYSFFAQVAAVGHITVYLRRFVTNDIRRMLIIVPGLKVHKIEAAASKSGGGGGSVNAAAAAGEASSSPSPTSPLADRRRDRDRDSNGISRATTVHGTVESLATMSSAPTPAYGQLTVKDLPGPSAGGSSAIGYWPIPMQSGSPPCAAIRKATLLMLMTETDTTQQQAAAAAAAGGMTSLHPANYMMTGSRVQSDIF